MRTINIVNADTLEICQRPTPEPKRDEVLIKVHAAGLNRLDIMQRKGLYPPPEGATNILGLEVAGTVAALGNSSTHLNIGDKVCALVTGGGYAEYCVASSRLCLAIPEGFSFTMAAALPETFFTVWSNLFDRAHLQADEILLVHGGSSGIGTTAIQLAKTFGAKVIITAGSDEKCQFCRDLGADLTIDYHLQDFVEEIRNYTNGNGVNIILDMIGGDYFARNIKCMAFDARLIQIALQNGIKADINLLPIMLKRLSITGSTLRVREIEFKAKIARQLEKNVWPLLARGKIKPIIYQTFPLAEAAKSHALMESSQHIGKIILTVE